MARTSSLHTDRAATALARGRRSRAALAAPLDASSGRQQRHRLNRTGNRQLNHALHIIAVTQARIYAPARDYLARRRADGKTTKEALRAVKRHLIRRVYQLLKTQVKRETITVDSPIATACLT